ncbi:MAG: S49 family peptidase [Pseudomonadota bacterium]
MRDLLRHLAAETGETLWAVDDSRLAASPGTAATGSAGIAVVPLRGLLVPRTINGWFGRIPGMDAFRSALGAAAANADVAAIVLDVNSPGGTYAATPETAEAVRRVAAVKPVIAMVDTLAASAAYFIASQATEVVVTPSGELGSIGVVAVHQEGSKMFEDIGIRTTIIRSRASKADVNPYEPLTEEARAALEASVAEADAEFLKAVGKGRNMTVAQVRQLVDDNGLGRAVGAKQGVSLGLADRVATIGEVLAGMVKPKAPKRRSAFVFD